MPGLDYMVVRSPRFGSPVKDQWTIQVVLDQNQGDHAGRADLIPAIPFEECSRAARSSVPHGHQCHRYRVCAEASRELINDAAMYNVNLGKRSDNAVIR